MCVAVFGGSPSSSLSHPPRITPTHNPPPPQKNTTTNQKKALAVGHGPYFYLPKMEGHLEARLWNDAFNLAQVRGG